MHQVMNQECLIHQDLGCVTEVFSIIFFVQCILYKSIPFIG